MRLSCLFIVQGEGRGHMTQALALRRMLHRAGHDVCAVLVGSARQTVPAYFRDKIDAPLHFFESPGFVTDGRHRSIQWLATLRRNSRRSPRFRSSLASLHHYVRRYRPDLIVNFFEPLTGLYTLRYKPTVPVVCIAHQFMALHPRYPMPPGSPIQRRAMTLFARLAAAGATMKLALSLYPAPSLTAQRLQVVPPLLRDELFEQPLAAEEPFFLVYLWDPDMAEALLRWHARHPDVALHAFWDNPEAQPVEVYDATLTFHRFHDERFLNLMARSRGVVTTAGFECMSEAMYLGKPLLMAPIQGQFEQRCNLIDAEQVGAGIGAEEFDIDRLIDFLPAYQRRPEPFRAWVDSAENRVLGALETAVRRHRRLRKAARTPAG